MKDELELTLWALFWGTFAAETVKNVAKGTATSLQIKVSELLSDEFVTLKLSANDTPEQIQEKVESNPEIKEQIQKKLEANTELFERLLEAMKDKNQRLIKTKTYIENAGDITINQ